MRAQMFFVGLLALSVAAVRKDQVSSEDETPKKAKKSVSFGNPEDSCTQQGLVPLLGGHGLDGLWPTFPQISCVEGREYREQCPSDAPYLVRGEARYCCSESLPSDIQEQCCRVLRYVASGFDRQDNEGKAVDLHLPFFNRYKNKLGCDIDEPPKPTWNVNEECNVQCGQVLPKGGKQLPDNVCGICSEHERAGFPYLFMGTSCSDLPAPASAIGKGETMPIKESRTFGGATKTCCWRSACREGSD